LIQTYNPLYIYAFGSYAKGFYGIDSDLDVMVVIDEYEGQRWQDAARGYQDLLDVLMSVDLILYNRAQFDECKKDSTSFCHKILKTGKLLYERKES
jgi:predicted nucleotidyltransferase